jgi:hypothetical protein
MVDRASWRGQDFEEGKTGGYRMILVPHEFNIGGVYLPPILIAGLVGLIAAVATARLLNRYRLSKYFFYPPLVFLALMVIYTVLVGTFIIGI